MTVQHTSASTKLYVGIDAGSVSLNGMVIDEKKQILYESPYVRHMGKVEENVIALIRELYKRFGQESIICIAFTGNHGKKLSERLGMFYEFEIISQVLGAIHIQPDVRTVMSLGGQDTALAQINHHGAGWELAYFNTNGPCASGTGSFIDQQAERLATDVYKKRKGKEQRPIDSILDDFISLGLKSQKPASVACRCTVFTKYALINDRREIIRKRYVPTQGKPVLPGSVS